MATVARAVEAVSETRFVINGLGWEEYEQIVEALGRTRVRCTYDSGTLELMSPSPEHESSSRIFLFIVHELADAFGVDYQALGSTTFRKQVVAKGLEPDECFYFENWPRIAGKDRLDLDVDPPPDLAVEIDITSDSLDREGIYAALGVPELWRFDGEVLTFHRLDPQGVYRPIDQSPYFPGIDPAWLLPFVEQARTISHRVFARNFRDHLRGRLGRDG